MMEPELSEQLWSKDLVFLCSKEMPDGTTHIKILNREEARAAGHLPSEERSRELFKNGLEILLKPQSELQRDRAVLIAEAANKWDMTSEGVGYALDHIRPNEFLNRE